MPQGLLCAMNLQVDNAFIRASQVFVCRTLFLRFMSHKHSWDILLPSVTSDEAKLAETDLTGIRKLNAYTHTKKPVFQLHHLLSLLPQSPIPHPKT